MTVAKADKETKTADENEESEVVTSIADAAAGPSTGVSGDSKSTTQAPMEVDFEGCRVRKLFWIVF